MAVYEHAHHPQSICNHGVSLYMDSIHSPRVGTLDIRSTQFFNTLADGVSAECAVEFDEHSDLYVIRYFSAS